MIVPVTLSVIVPLPRLTESVPSVGVPAATASGTVQAERSRVSHEEPPHLLDSIGAPGELGISGL